MEKTATATAAAACGDGDGGGGDPDVSILLLPEDFLIEILVRLPAVSLLRFKSVCKSWRDLIQTSFFIHLHSTFNSSSSSSNFGTFILRTDNLTNENEILMVSEYEGSEYGSEYGDGYRCTDGSWHKFTGGGGGGDYDCEEDLFDDYTVGCNDDDKDNQEEVFKADDDDDDQLLLKIDKLELPSGYTLNLSRVIVGSCNGLICLHDESTCRDVSLWNPATRQFRTLPKPITIEIDDDDLVQYGVDFVAFGFDVKCKDHKVLLIKKIGSKNIVARPRKVVCRVQVYSLSTDSWRILEGINFPLAGPAEHNGLYLNGSCFFIAVVYHPESNTDSCWFFINSFDFTKEIFTTMQLPPDHDHRQHLFLRCLGGEKMALFTTLRMRPMRLMRPSYQYDSDSSNDADDSDYGNDADGPSYEYDSDGSNDANGYEDCDIWVLNEQHGRCDGSSSVNKESWTKLHSFQIKNNRSGEPIGISNNGKFALLQTTGLSYDTGMRLYNLVTKEVKLDIPLCVSTSKVYVYKPSLVSISSPAIG